MSTKAELRRSKNASIKNKREAEDRKFWKSVTSKKKAVNLLQDLKYEVAQILELKQQMERDYPAGKELAGALHTLNHALTQKLRRIARLEISIIENLQSPSGAWLNPKR